MTLIARYLLGSAVLAGNMYVEDNLLKNPPYHFQMIYSDKVNRILRRSVQLQVDGLESESVFDTTQKNSFFESICSNLVECNYQKISDKNRLLRALDKRLTVRNIRILLNLQQGFTICIDSPVKHFNNLKYQNQWQIETGPVLFVKEQIENCLDDVEVIEKLSPSFLHTNSFSKAQFTFEYPFFVHGKMDSSEHPKSIQKDCNIELYLSND